MLYDELIAFTVLDKDDTKNNSLNAKIVLFLKVGIYGGFTTFSSFAPGTSDLMKSGNFFIALLYIVLSITVGIFAVLAGQKLFSLI